MDIKKCESCKKDKPYSDFYIRTLKTKVILQPICKECTKAYHKEHYKRNKEKYRLRAKAYKKKMQALLSEIKNKPCADCGGIFHPIAMDFDHTDDNKIGNVSALVLRSSWDKVLKEIEKCDLVCSNCHRVRTYNRHCALMAE